MALTTQQLQTLKTAILAETDAAFVQARNDGDTRFMADWYNVPSTFIVRRKRVESSEIGPILNYVAVAALTTTNRDKATTFLTLNPVWFEPTPDVETYWNDTFGGALGGQGQATRDALIALWRRAATRGERLYATGTGTTATPGTLGWEGTISTTDIINALGL